MSEDNNWQSAGSAKGRIQMRAIEAFWHECFGLVIVYEVHADDAARLNRQLVYVKHPASEHRAEEIMQEMNPPSPLAFGLN